MGKVCYHCGTPTQPSALIVFDGKDFCCAGCKTVYEIFSESHLTSYYEMERTPGARPESNPHKYAFLDNAQIVNRLLDFNDEGVQIVTLYIPHIHCSSCIWILENLKRLQPAITSSQVDFPKKKVRIVYNSDQTNLKQIVELLSRIGYAPYISLEDYNRVETHQSRTIYYKLGVAGFAFGNVMLLSFPEYFENDEFWLNQYKFFFRWMMFFLSLPVVFYASSDYFISAYKGIKTKMLNIDVPLALGIIVLFLRSTYEVVTQTGSGFFDSLTGLLFFLLLGRFFQQKTYSFLSFERDYKSYFPIGVTKILPDGSEQGVEVYKISKGDRLLIRSEEIIPVDVVLIKGEGMIDYSFVTGESLPVHRVSGDKLFAGGRQTQGAIEVEVLKEVSQSYLTQLWSNAIFDKDYNDKFKTLTDRVSKYFTYVILTIATLAFAYWAVFVSVREAVSVFTSVLIIACPCALAMSAPFTLGNMLRFFGYSKFYLKNARVIEKMAKVSAIVFDKTGTITTSQQGEVTFQGVELSPWQKMTIKSILRNSNHPLSRAIYNASIMSGEGLLPLSSFEEFVGKGLLGVVNHQQVKIGSAKWVNVVLDQPLDTQVCVSINGEFLGYFLFKNVYRTGVSQLFKRLSSKYTLAILSGDNESEYETLRAMLPDKVTLSFNQKPSDKLHYIKALQRQGHSVMMIGDGLNDAGALRQSDVGLAISENVNVFSPACDGIVDAEQLSDLDYFMILSKKSVKIIKMSFMLSFFYNVIGLSFAVMGGLSPVVAAILMPLSSISVVVFTTVVTRWFSYRKKRGILKI